MRLIKVFYYIVLMFRDYLFCKYYFGFYKKTWRFWGIPEIYSSKGAMVSIGENVVFCSDSRRNEIGLNQKVFIRLTSGSASLSIGDDVGMSGCTISCVNKIVIGNGVMIGAGALLMDHDAHPIHPDVRRDKKHTISAPIFIEDDVFVGARAIILKGVSIGRGSVIGAGAVVTRNVPPMSIVAGNPARVVSQIKDLNFYLN